MNLNKLTEEEQRLYERNIKWKKEGYTIYKITRKMSEITLQGEITLHFVKNEKRNTLRFRKPSNEIKKYINHHQIMTNKEHQSVYINLDEINLLKIGRMERITPFGFKDGKIIIENTEFPHFGVLKFGEVESAENDKTVQFKFILEINRENLEKVKKLDFRHPVELTINNETHFKGKIDVVRISNNHDRIIFYCSHFGYIFPYGDDYVYAGDQRDLQKFLMDYFELEDIFQIKGYHSEERDYLVEMGFVGLKMTDYIRLGNIGFGKPGENTAIYEFFPDEVHRMIMNLKATSYMDAIRKTRFFFIILQNNLVSKN